MTHDDNRFVDATRVEHGGHPLHLAEQRRMVAPADGIGQSVARTVVPQDPPRRGESRDQRIEIEPVAPERRHEQQRRTRTLVEHVETMLPDRHELTG